MSYLIVNYMCILNFVAGVAFGIWAHKKHGDKVDKVLKDLEK